MISLIVYCGLRKVEQQNEASKGYLRECEGGTLVIDEIGDLSYDVQTTFRAIEYKVIEPVGIKASENRCGEILGAMNKKSCQARERRKIST